MKSFSMSIVKKAFGYPAEKGVWAYRRSRLRGMVKIPFTKRCDVPGVLRMNPADGKSPVAEYDDSERVCMISETSFTVLFPTIDELAQPETTVSAPLPIGNERILLYETHEGEGTRSQDPKGIG